MSNFSHVFLSPSNHQLLYKIINEIAQKKYSIQLVKDFGRILQDIMTSVFHIYGVDIFKQSSEDQAIQQLNWGISLRSISLLLLGF